MLPSRVFLPSSSSLVSCLAPTRWPPDGPASRADDRLANVDGFMSDICRSLVLIHWVVPAEVEVEAMGCAEITTAGSVWTGSVGLAVAEVEAEGASAAAGRVGATEAPAGAGAASTGALRTSFLLRLGAMAAGCRLELG